MVATLAPPSDDKRWRIVETRMRRLGQAPDALIEVLHAAQEAFGYLDTDAMTSIGASLDRVGSLARVNVADQMGTPRADEELQEFRARLGRVASSSFHYHQARLIDVLHCLERMEELLVSQDILAPRVRSVAGINRNEGVGVAEAPRGTLIHHYRVDDDGIVQWANLVIATGHNNLAMNRGVLQVAREYVHGDRLTAGMLNRVEAVIRCYDPCLSCSTHAIGQMPMRLQLLARDGTVLDEVTR